MTTLGLQTDASSPSQGSRDLDRVLWRAFAALAGILPAAAAAYANRSIVDLFHSISITGSGGVGTVAAGLYELNRPVIVAIIAAAILAAALSIAWLFKPAKSRDFPDILLSTVVLIAACGPTLLLWKVETLTIGVTMGHVTMPVAEASNRISSLILAGFFTPLILIPLLFVGAVISIALARPIIATPPRLNAALWIVTTLLLAAMAGSFYARSSYLHEVALRGRL